MYLAFRDEVAAVLRGALEALGHPTDDLGIEEPPEGVDAVLATSVSFRLAGRLDEPPPAVAAELADAIDVTACEYVGEIRVEGPYVNFLPGAAYFEATLGAAQSTAYGRLDPRDTSVVVEHTSANPTGPIHVGRARNPIVGDALANVLDLAGYEVERHYYVNDAGRQMAVFAWAYETFDEADLPDPDRPGAEYDLVRYYRKGTEYLETAPEEDVEAAESEIRAIMEGLENGDEAAYERVNEVVEGVLGGMQDSLGRLPAEFDEFVRETRFLRDGSTEDVVGRLRELDEAVFEDDAWQLDLTGAGIEKNLVFLRSDGTTLYTTRDLAHHEWKFAEFDRAVTVLGEDHGLQADQLRATLDLLGHDTDRLDHVLYSYVNLPEGTMSTRRGTGIHLDDLLDEAVERARQEVEKRIETRRRNDELGAADVDRIARQVGIGAVRYDVVATQPSKGITFRWEDALDFEAQSAPYVQYVHARCCGILDEARRAGHAVPGQEYRDGHAPGVQEPTTDEDVSSLEADASALDTAAERDLLRVIARYPGVIERAAEELEPHRVATYTRTFAERFNAFYRECPVIDAADGTREARLALVAASRNTVASALGALGVAAPESM